MKTISEFKDWFKKARKDEFEQLEFTWELMKTPYTEFHYQLIISKDTNDDFRSTLWSRFNEHGEEAAQLLLSKLENNDDINFHANIIFYLGKIADQKKYSKQKFKTMLVSLQLVRAAKYGKMQLSC